MAVICRSCGAELDEKGVCPSCGRIEEGVKDMTGTTYMTQQASAAYKPAQQNSGATSVSGWIGWMLLCSFLPIVGCLLTIFLAPDRSVKNYAKAMIIFEVLALVIAVIIYAAFGSMIIGLLGGTQGQVRMNM